jgi:hypothetical protein
MVLPVICDYRLTKSCSTVLHIEPRHRSHPNCSRRQVGRNRVLILSLVLG